MVGDKNACSFIRTLTFFLYSLNILTFENQVYLRSSDKELLLNLFTGIVELCETCNNVRQTSSAYK